MNYRRGILDRIALSQVDRRPDIPAPGLGVDLGEDLTPQPVQVVLTEHTRDHFAVYDLPVETQEDLDKMGEPIDPQEFPVISGWFGDAVVAY